jgi:hypothetical protein
LDGFDEAEWHHVLAGVSVSVHALWAVSVADVERDGDVVSFLNRLDVVADFDDVPGGFVAENLTGFGLDSEPLPVTLPPVPVTAADTTGFEFDDGAGPVGFWCVYVFDFERFTVLFEDCCSHSGTNVVPNS